MKNRILSSFITVFAFWYLAVYVWGIWQCACLIWPTWQYALYGGVLAVAAWAIGWAVQRLWPELIHDDLTPKKKGRVQFSLGETPRLPSLPKHKGKIGLPQTVLTHLRTMPSPHQRLAVDLLLTLQAANDVPVGADRIVHCGATLIQHTIRVLIYAIEHLESWKGSQMKADGQSLPKELHAVAILGVLAHDLGKILCFQEHRPDPDNPAEIKRAYRFHDRVGGRALAMMDNYWSLPNRDRELLMAAVALGHHAGEVPEHLGIEGILVTEFVHDMDVRTTQEERKETQNQLRKPTSEQQREWLIDVILRDGILNNPTEGVVFRSDSILLFNEPTIRKMLAEELYQDETLAALQNAQGASPLIDVLLEALDEAGWLYVEHEGARFSAKNALFRVASFNKKGRRILEWPRAFAVFIESLPIDQDKLENPLHTPFIEEPVWSNWRKHIPLQSTEGDGAIEQERAPKRTTESGDFPGLSDGETSNEVISNDVPIDDEMLRSLMEITPSQSHKVKRKAKTRKSRPIEQSAPEVVQPLEKPVIENEEIDPDRETKTENGKIVQALIEAADDKQVLYEKLSWSEVRRLAIAGGIQKLEDMDVEQMATVAKARPDLFDGAVVYPDGIKLINLPTGCPGGRTE